MALTLAAWACTRPEVPPASERTEPPPTIPAADAAPTALARAAATVSPAQVTEQQVREVLALHGAKEVCNQLNGCDLPRHLAALGRGAATHILAAFDRSKSDAWWRFRSLEALGRIGGPEAEAGLVRVFLEDAMPPARAEAALALGRGAMRGALPALRTVATQSPRPPVSVLLATAYALSRLRDPLGAALFTEHLVVPEGGAKVAPGARRVDVDTRWHELRPGIWAAGELRLVGHLQVVQEAALRGEPFTRRDAVVALSKLRQPRAIPTLIEALADELPSTRKLAQEALVSLTGKRTLSTAAEWRAYAADAAGAKADLEVIAPGAP